MDWIGIIGAVLALFAVIFGNFLEGGQLQSLANLPAAVIVLGGTFGAMVLQSPKPQLIKAFSLIRWIVFPPETSEKKLIEDLTYWGVIARKDGLIALENLADQQSDLLTKKGLMLLADGHEPDSIRKAMELDVEVWEQFTRQGAKFYESAGGYAPTIGIIGAVLGLIHVLGNMNDSEALGRGIATAFVATIYGVGLANLILLPIGNRLKDLLDREYRAKELLIEGLVYIAEGENPNSIKHKLIRASQ